MWDRLKSLPLTIVLTILTWMYAEAQFTTTQEGITIALKVASPSRDYAVRVLDAADGRYRTTVPLRITVQGAKGKVERLYQQSIGQTAAEEEWGDLVYALKQGGVVGGGG